MRRDAFLSALAAVTALPALPGHGAVRTSARRLPPDVRMDPWQFDGTYYSTNLTKTLPSGTVVFIGVDIYRLDVYHAIEHGFLLDLVQARLDAAIAMLNEPLESER